ncbi:MAG: 1-deoxy-D-xylulose-5-phosphate synthase [Pseudomonadota bacterium]
MPYETSPDPLTTTPTSAKSLKSLSLDELPNAAEQVRAAIIDTVSKIGGHLGSSLGVVELTVALHRVFDTPKDKFIWDVSHQCYPHKLLTGRADRLNTLRQGGGLAGFTCRDESEHDCFGAAHSSTSISAGVGFATARDLAGSDESVVAIIGDGALSGGMALEGLNNLGALGKRMIVILNDNDMSIAPPSGALANHLRDLAAAQTSCDKRAAALEADPLAKLVDLPTLFEPLGVKYAGPYDGHDVIELVRALQAAKAYEGPVLLHVRTVKGKGYAPAEAATDCYHGVAPFDVETGKQNKPAAPPACQKIFGQTLVELAKTDDKIVAVSAAMPSGTSVDMFAKAYPDRAFDAGIAEQHAVTFAAGLAAGGYKPFAAIYSTFLQRGYDQVVHDVAIQRLPVRFMIDRAGMVGADGVTHQGAYDIAYLGCLPGFVLMGAADELELAAMVATAAAIEDRPSAVRYPRGALTGVAVETVPAPLEIGRGRIVRDGGDVAILSYGGRLADTLAAAETLAGAGVRATVADARFAKPIDDALVMDLFDNHAAVVTVEEGAIGGFATLVADALHRAGRGDLLARHAPMYLPDRFIHHDKPAKQVAEAGLDAEAIAARAALAIGIKAAARIAAE